MGGDISQAEMRFRVFRADKMSLLGELREPEAAITYHMLWLGDGPLPRVASFRRKLFLA